MSKVLVVPSEDEGQRLDVWLSERLGISRSRAKQLIREGHVRINGRGAKPSTPLTPGTRVEVELPRQGAQLEPEEMDLAIIYEDDELVVVNKPSGVVVYPAAGHAHGTLLQGLLKGRKLAEAGAPHRPGVVHRLDKGTSGVMVFAKSDEAYHGLVRQFKARKVHKEYLALVHGLISEDEGLIEAPIGRDIHRRQRMGIRAHGGKQAATEFRVLKRSEEFTLIRVRPKTGRTHQIRVHLRAIGHPIVGDERYGPKSGAKRLMLHAWKLGIHHPKSGRRLEFTAPPPEEFLPYLEGLSLENLPSSP
jgi:23S rRNA pseudouridine1911/1915/1917 synthase